MPRGRQKIVYVAKKNPDDSNNKEEKNELLQKDNEETKDNENLNYKKKKSYKNYDEEDEQENESHRKKKYGNYNKRGFRKYYDKNIENKEENQEEENNYEIKPIKIYEKKEKISKNEKVLKINKEEEKIEIKKEIAKKERKIRPVVIIEEEKVDLSKLNLVPVDEKRKPISILVYGIYESGKSTLCANFEIFAGKIDPRILAKYEQEAKEKNKESIKLTYIMDILDEEKELGRSTDIGQVNFVTESKRIKLFDTPGHYNYFQSMVTFAGIADYGILVVSAKKGEFENGFEKTDQNKEQILISKIRGIEKIIVVINKMDDPSVNWSKQRYEKIKSDLSKYISTIYSIEKEVIFIPISAFLNQNIFSKLDQSICDWYSGPSLLEIIDNYAIPTRDDSQGLRIQIYDKVKTQGNLPLIFGKVISGTAKIGSKVLVMPIGNPSEISSIYNDDENMIPFALNGEIISFRLKNIEEENDINQGSLICGVANVCAIFQLFTVEIKVIGLLKSKPLISKGYKCICHMNLNVEEVEFEKLDEKDVETKVYRPVFFLKENSIASCVLKSNRIICGENINLQKQKFILRDEGKTIAIGKITKLFPYENLKK